MIQRLRDARNRRKLKQWKRIAESRPEVRVHHRRLEEAHTGQDEHPIGSSEDCPACRRWRR